MDIRSKLIDAINQEIIGPGSNPEYIDSKTDEEVLLRYVHGSPKSRYGAGMLYPKDTINPGETDSGEQLVDESDEEELEPETPESLEKQHRKSASKDELDYEEPVGLANQFLPSAMGFTIRFNEKESNSTVSLEIESAYYERVQDDEYPKKYINSKGQVNIVTNKEGEPLLSDYWVRRPIKIEPIRVQLETILDGNKKKDKKVLKKTDEGNDWLSLKIYDRTTPDDKQDGCLTYTFVLVNDYESTTNRSENDKHILYQNKLKLTTGNENLITAYKEREKLSDTEEEKKLNLLYRKKRVFGIGHGTSVNWKSFEVEGKEKVKEISTSVIPTFEMLQIAPTHHVELSMLELSDLGDWNKAIKGLDKLVDRYDDWVDKIEEKIDSKELEDYKIAARTAIEKCRFTKERISRGIKILKNAKEDDNIVKCFRWMNRAMLWQQQRSNANQRKWQRTGKSGNPRYVLEGINGSDNQTFQSLGDFCQTTKFGTWYPFQIAFILMNLESIINPKSDEREIVDLIWFPTGGGKTEAYLGLAAFTIFYRRIQGEEIFDHEPFGGTTVFMRYTLRLLTTQQYERAASLICACDIIRNENVVELGSERISIGLWVGGTSTPNTNADARAQFNKLNGKNHKYEPYNFVVMKCPCCGAQIGKIQGAKIKDPKKVKGLTKEDGKDGEVKFKCENENCEYFESELPLRVIDDYIYENPPTLLLGTVDKFAMIPWKKKAGNLFGFREDGNDKKRIKPPELIIQDELHLISGPLGSMVGMYETMIQTLCNDYGLNDPPFIDEERDYIPPKIVASSATISRAKEQVQALYGTEKLHIFPSQGLEFGNTWFSEEESLNTEDEDGNPRYPGRLYAGILASGYPSAQTAIVRAYSSILQKAKELDDKDSIDYYWTLLGYFNSIRELGGAMSLIHGDIRERLSQIQKRELVKYDNRRNLYDWKIQELTSRISSDKIPEVLKKLEKNYDSTEGTHSNALDVCLATNMVATGVDISRLGLMFIHGQPKTTAEYIQASSRVGRDLPDGPGLVFTLYSPAKPRDKSQYEQFQGYHSRIYSNVEPTSVTPFSVNVRERALHAVLIGLIRHFSNSALTENPSIDADDFQKLTSMAKDIILKRCQIVNPEEKKHTKKLLEKRIEFWQKTGPQHYGDAGNYGIKKNEDYYPLLYANSSEVKMDVKEKSLATPTSMRGVDTESKIEPYSIV